ncbi:hypothetical protein, partial [Staphylococcus schleiferi]|uniref:hypothetical protein n=1 Tax=Staphylococcus schleiferi TaxID=1295 RepID=UPI002480F949
NALNNKITLLNALSSRQPTLTKNLNKNRCKSLENDTHLSLKTDQLKTISGQLLSLLKTVL